VRRPVFLRGASASTALFATQRFPLPGTKNKTFLNPITNYNIIDLKLVKLDKILKKIFIGPKLRAKIVKLK